jgi:hypothetical protein
LPGADRSRATRPGSVIVIVAFAVLVGLLGYGVYRTVHGQRRPVPLPKGMAADHVVLGTYTSPALTVAGDEVRVEAPTFSALAEVTGPLVPGEGMSYQPRYVTGTWTVRVWDVKGTVPLGAADFDTVDHLGTQYHLAPPVGATVPASVATGHDATFELRGVVPVGETLVRWAPNGHNVIAKWDNIVEND